MVLLAACTKDPMIGNHFTTYTYAETQCSDPWGRAATDSLTLRNLSAYLTARKIEFMNLGIQKTDSAQVCNACICKTGNQLSVTFLGLKDSTVSRMQQLGFNRMPDE